ncbi:hypothetical protein [Bradyrhizobium sp. Tv2a-2]|uniref:hypothetical protein n=1 Tax=Bradyrhizobium sp. Tv2a-2 TaxID=113395 RepID=UPI0004130761|nr:hypothetical protein [Bradyrhizobium sp. Tv2a-2]
MVRLVAPDGVTHFSHNGHEFEVGEDGHVEVADHIAPHLLPHGFRTPDTVIADTTPVHGVTRKDLIDVLELFGVGVNGAMRSEKLIAVFRETVKAKTTKPVKTAEKAVEKQAAK